MMLYRILFALGMTACLLASGCSRNTPAGEYDTSEVGKIRKVATGTIISKRPVKFHNKSQEAQAQATTANPGTDFVDGGKGFVYVIRLNSGTIVSVAQSEDLKLKVGRKVLVVYGAHTRILPDNSKED